MAVSTLPPVNGSFTFFIEPKIWFGPDNAHLNTSDTCNQDKIMTSIPFKDSSFAHFVYSNNPMPHEKAELIDKYSLSVLSGLKDRLIQQGIHQTCDKSTAL